MTGRNPAQPRRTPTRDHLGRFARRPPDQIGPATMGALLHAYAVGDAEGVRVIVATCDHGLLVDRLLEAVLLLGSARYGSRGALAAAMADLVQWLAVLDAGRGGS